MSDSAPAVIETLTRVAPFGLALWDVAAGRPASDGLAVRVFALAGGRALAPTAASANRAGVFVAYGLPGLREFEGGAGDAGFWAAVAPSRPFLVEVRDPLGRFVPFVLHVRLPAPRGLVVPACIADLWPQEPASPPQVVPSYVPLFSAPARRVPGGRTAVRATLVDADTGAPAAFAVLEVRESGRLLACGVADERGEVAAVFAYPELPDAPVQAATSPPGPPAPASPLAKQTWPLDVSIRYRRGLASYAPDAARIPLPDLCEVLTQPAASLAIQSQSTVLAGATLRYGEELLLGEEASRELHVRPS